MKISMYVESVNLDDVAKPISSAIVDWIKATGSAASFVDKQDQEGSRQLGIELNIRKKGELKDPLKKLYEIANKNKSEFAVGIVDQKTGLSEEVCFFGREEGKPDAFEIANYLGLI